MKRNERTPLKILVVEDDQAISAPIAESLRFHHYAVDVVDDGPSALQAASKQEYDLLLLDVMIPGIDGLTVCRSLRESGFKGFIVMLTALGTKENRIIGLDSGADDYLVKPFALDELNAKIRSFLRRSKDETEFISEGNVRIDLRACVARYKEQALALTPTEYRLLVTFVRSPQRTFSKHDLIDRLWSDSSPTDAVVKAHIKSLRQKLEQAGASKELVQTVYGFGYRLNANAR